VEKMTLGQVVDFCIDYNKQHKSAETKKTEPKARKATQADWNAFFGR